MKYVLHANIVILFNATQKFYTQWDIEEGFIVHCE